MKLPASRTLCLATVALLAASAGGDPAPQPQMQFTKGLQGTFNADWQGGAGLTYFTQFSMNLIDWHYAPFIDFGDDMHHRGIESDAEKFFLRLFYGDFPGINSLEDAMNADFDNDGLSNIFEVMNGMDPFAADMNSDTEEDGLLLSNEQQYGTSPHRRDNPAVKLSVVVGN